MNAIEISNISKRYNIRYGAAGYLADLFSKKKRDILALDNVSLELPEGTCTGLIGVNGSGKTTLLKILSGITKPSAGRFNVKGRIGPLIQVGAGFHPELTGRENVFLYGSILGMMQSEIRAKYDEIVEFAGMKEFMDTPIKKYSSGMYIRLGFSVAVNSDPDILLIDEVLAVGDYMFRLKSLDKIKQLKALGKTIVFVSHNLEQVTAICEKTALLNKGNLVSYGNTLDVMHEYTGLFLEGQEEEPIEQYIESRCSIIKAEVDSSGMEKDRELEAHIEIDNPDSEELIVNIILRGRVQRSYFEISTSARDIAFTCRRGSIHIKTGKLNIAPGLYAVNIDIRRKGNYALLYTKKNACYFKVNDFAGYRFGNYQIDNFTAEIDEHTGI